MPDQPRVDPPSRPVDGSVLSASRLINQDPRREYVKANPNDEWTGIAAMKQLGFEVERHRKDGPRVIGGETSKDGDLLTEMGQVWMSRPIEMMHAAQEHRRRVAMERWESMGRKGGVDRVRDPGGQLAQVSIKA